MSEKTLEAFYAWLKETVKTSYTVTRSYLDKCKANVARRFNQGDKFIASELGIVGDISTEVEKSADPLAMKIIEG